MTDASTLAAPGGAGQSFRRRVLSACCGAHFLHDGVSDLINVLLPVWQGELALSLAEVGLLKSVAVGCLAGFQVPSGLAARRLGERRVLVLGTALVGVGLMLAGITSGFVALAGCLAIIGIGLSVQHPLSSSLVAGTYEGPALRIALSTYNFSGDLGKVALPALTASLVVVWQWRGAVAAIGVALLVGAAVVAWALGPSGREARHSGAAAATPGRLSPQEARHGFLALSSIAMIDSVTRSGFTTFLPFLLTMKGAPLQTVGLALSLVFAGGAAGKLVCGVIARRVGVLRAVILTECATAAGILLLLPLTIAQGLFLLPLVGIALNGTSSVLYGTVAELAPAERRARAFGIFYTVGIGASALAPSIYGLFSDAIGVPSTLTIIAGVVLLVLPLTVFLRAPLKALHAA